MGPGAAGLRLEVSHLGLLVESMFVISAGWRVFEGFLGGSFVFFVFVAVERRAVVVSVSFLHGLDFLDVVVVLGSFVVELCVLEQFGLALLVRGAWVFEPGGVESSFG